MSLAAEDVAAELRRVLAGMDKAEAELEQVGAHLRAVLEVVDGVIEGSKLMPDGRTHAVCEKERRQ